MSKVKSIFVSILLILTALFCVNCVGTEQKKYDLSFLVDGNVYAVVETTGDEAITLPQQPIKHGYDFDGWFWEDGRIFMENSLVYNPITEDTNLYARFSPTVIEAQQITLSSSALSLKEGETASVLATVFPENTTDKAVTWSSSDLKVATCTNGKIVAKKAGVCVISVTTHNGKTAECAVTVKPINNAITYDLDGGENHPQNPDSYKTDSSVTFGDATKTGYTFLGWTMEDMTTPTKNLQIQSTDWGDKTLTAHWQANAYTATFDANGGQCATEQSQFIFDLAATLPVPTRVGYDFVGWECNGVKVDSEIWKIAKDCTLTAVWVVKTDIPYTLHNWLPNLDETKWEKCETVQKKGTTDALIEPTEYVGYQLKEPTTITVKADGTLVADCYYVRKTFSITMVTNGGNPLDSVTYKFEAPVSALPQATRENYTFGGWFENPNLTDAFACDKMPANDITVYAWWTKENKPSDFEYTLDQSGNITIDKYLGTEDAVVVIPAYIAGAKVTCIGARVFYNSSQLACIILPDSLLSIGDGAFSGCSSLTSITLPSSVTSIGYYAFSDCSSLTSITIPNSVTSIKSYAFSGCSSLTSITIPDSVTSIGDDAFEGCSRLTSATIGNGVKSIGGGAFANCSRLMSATIGNGVKSIGGSAFFNCSWLTSITIPDSVTSIEQKAFYRCDSLASVTIGNGVTSIGSDAFWGCSSLTKVNYTGTVDKWAMIWFSDDDSNPLYYAKHLYINDVEVTEVNLTTATKISDYAFYNCSSLTSITIPDSVKSIGGGAFANSGRLTSITIPDSVTSIGEEAFYSCSSLTNIYLTDIAAWCGITGLSDLMSYGESKNLYLNGELLTSVTIPDSVTSIGKYTFYNCSGLISITIPDSVTSIGRSAFSGCSSIVSITIPFVGSTKEGTSNTCFGCIFGANSFSDNDDYVPSSLKTIVITGGTSIGYYAFSDCSSLRSITIPDSVTSIGQKVFEGCIGLTEITLPYIKSRFAFLFGGSYYTTVPSGLKTVIITGGTSIAQEAFYYCESLTSITIPDSVTSIGQQAFYYCNSLTKVNFTGTIDQWAMIDFKSNPLYYAKHLYINDVEVTQVNLTTATYISDYAFEYCSSLTSIAIPDSVTSIGRYAFYNCESLRSITIPDSVTSIGANTFSGCSSLRSITIPDSVTSIGDLAFAYCRSLKSITVGNGVRSIGNAAFSNCSGCMSVKLPASLLYIGDFVFQGCYSLIEVWNLSSIPITKGSTTNGYVGYYALDIYTSSNENSKLQVTDNGYTYYEDGDIVYLMRYEGEEKQVQLQNQYNGKKYDIYHYAFHDLKTLESITLPDSVTSIGNYTFYNCKSLTSITLPSSVTSIGDGAFSGCSSLTSITLPSSVTSIGDRVFDGCSGLTSIIIPDSVTSIGKWAFEDCTSLTKIYIPLSVTTMGQTVFLNCRSLKIYCAVDSKPSGWNEWWCNYGDKSYEKLYPYWGQATPV